MVDDKMCMGVVKEEMMVWIGLDVQEIVFEKLGIRVMDFIGRLMKGYVFIEFEGLDIDDDFFNWVQVCLDFNLLVKFSKKKKKVKKQQMIIVFWYYLLDKMK